MATIANDTQFIGISPTIDLTGKKSAILNAQTEPVTMADITSTVRPYKVFSALLTQSGGDNPDGDSNFPLVIGRTYQIVNPIPEYILGDFTNVGAPNNEIGTYFIATGTTPNSWGENISLLFNTGAPVATVLENTIGNVWFSYSDDGAYSCYLQNAPYNKTYTNYQFIFTTDSYGNAMCKLATEDDNLVTISTRDATTGIPTNDKLPFQTPIEIRVYE